MSESKPERGSERKRENERESEPEPNPIPLFEIPWDHRDIANAVDAITRGSYWANGPYIEEFEQGLEEYLDVEHAVTVNSGTTALVAALWAHGIGEGDEVIVPSFTFIATANAVRLVGGTPVFADIERETYGLDPAAVSDVCTEETAAILPIHPYGTACEIDALSEIAADAGIPLIEDAAETFGAEYEGQRLGTIGDTGTLSFCQNKILPTGEGGAVVTDDDEIAQRVRRYRSHGRVSADYFSAAETGTYADLGTNVRMADLVASIGCAQLETVESKIAGRRRVAKRYHEGFSAVPGVRTHQPNGGRHVYQLYTVTLAEEIDRTAVIESLRDRSIASKVYWDPPVHRTEAYRDQGPNCGERSLPVTDEIAGRVLSLPIHPELPARSVDRVLAAVCDAIPTATVPSNHHL